MKRILSIFTILSILSIPSAQAATFSDVRSPELQTQVQYLSEKGIIKGYADGTFKPDKVINRAEALKIIFESRGIAVAEDGNSGFPDVDSSQWFAKYVTTAKKLGLIKGYADGTYKPAQSVNTVEFIKIAMLAQSYYEASTDHSAATSQFSDVGANEWYMPYVSFGFKKGFLARSSRLKPSAGITRGDAAYIIYQVAKFNESNPNSPNNPNDLNNPPETAALTCPTCVNGVDLSQYEWSKSSTVKIENGKLTIGTLGLTSLVVREQGTTKLTANSEANLESSVKDAELGEDIENTPASVKHNIDQDYPELFARIIGINGGKQVLDSYKESQTVGIIWKDKDGIRFRDCDCQFELNVINKYNGQGYELPFVDWRSSDLGKEKLYEVIRIHLYNQ